MHTNLLNKLTEHTNTKLDDWKPLTGGLAHTSITNGDLVFKYAGHTYNVHMEAELFKALNGYAEVLTDGSTSGLLMEYIGEAPTDHKKALEALPETLYRFSQLAPPAGVPDLSPYQQLLGKVEYRREVLKQSPFFYSWLEDELERAEPLASLLVGGGLVHGDVHLGNVRMVGERAALLDFEWVGSGAAAEFDIGTLLLSLLWREGEFVEGYNPLEFYPVELDSGLVEVGFLVKGLAHASFQAFLGNWGHVAGLGEKAGALGVAGSGLLRDSLSRLVFP